MHIFYHSFKISILVVLVISTFTFAQDDPNLDNTFGMERPTYKPPVEMDALFTEDGFENFFLGIDFAEPHIVANPLIPTQYFNAFNTNATHYTMDGVNWTFQVPAFGFNMRGDPVAAYDSLGNLYYENMYGTAGIEGCKVIKSTDNGVTWTSAVTSIAGVDKNWIAADQTSGPFANYVYTTMTAGSGIGRFARSTDFGATWQSTFTPGNQNLPGMMVAVGPNVIGGDVPGGIVYVVTNGGNAFAATYTFYTSTDGGSTFTLKSSQQFANYVGTNVSGRNSVENMRTRPYPFITADNSYTTFRGRLYLVYASNTPVGNGNKPDIFCRYSDDQGATWSSAVKINDDISSENNHQWMPATWCDKETGRLYVKWFDTRNVPSSDSAEVYASYSDDGGVSWVPNQNLSTSKFKIDCSTCGGGGTPRYQGDYDAITSNGVTSMAVWSDFRNGAFGSYVAYFPDFAMTISDVSDTMKQVDTLEIYAKVPGVKLYDNSVKFSAESVPFANFIYEYPDGDSLTSFPDSVKIRILSNNVSLGNYSIKITGRGPNGTPAHSRDLEVLITSPTTNLLQPNGGEVLYVGTEYPIKWETIFIDSVKLEYSTDGGSTWILISESAFDNSGGLNEYPWIVPNDLSNNCLVRIKAINEGNVFDQSDSSFSIEIAPAAGWQVLNSGIDSTILCIDVVDTLVAWAGTSDGEILRTTDGGLNWNLNPGNQGGRVTSIKAIDDRRAIVIVNSNSFTRIRRTVSFGVSWGTVYEDNSTGAHLNAIEFFDEDNGYVVGNAVNGNWVLLSTNDFGANWSSASTLPQNGSEIGFHNSMDWSNELSGWFGTNNSSVYQTTDGGVSWSSSLTSNQNNYGIGFTDDLNGVTSGNTTDVSNDGGITWSAANQQIPTVVQSVASIKNSNGRYFLSSGNTIYKSDNQFDTYSIDFTSTANIQFIRMKNVKIGENSWICGYAVGDDGSIAKYLEIVTVTDVETEVEQVPQNFVLQQNYPNPFNPNTVIEFFLPLNSDVTLSVFNILGQKIATLIDGDRSAGTHSVNWNATDSNGLRLSSGIYFYRLDAKNSDGNSFTEMKKMVLLK